MTLAFSNGVRQISLRCYSLDAGPLITEIFPDEVPTHPSYEVTIQGQLFGSVTGRVFVRPLDSNEEALEEPFEIGEKTWRSDQVGLWGEGSIAFSVHKFSFLIRITSMELLSKHSLMFLFPPFRE